MPGHAGQLAPALRSSRTADLADAACMHAWVFKHRLRLAAIYGLASTPAQLLLPPSAAAGGLPAPAQPTVHGRVVRTSPGRVVLHPAARRHTAR